MLDLQTSAVDSESLGRCCLLCEVGVMIGESVYEDEMVLRCLMVVSHAQHAALSTMHLQQPG